MLVQVAPNMLIDPEVIDLAYQPEGTEGHTLVFINGNQYPERANVDYETFLANLEKGQSRGFWKKVFRKS